MTSVAEAMASCLFATMRLNVKLVFASTAMSVNEAFSAVLPVW